MSRFRPLPYAKALLQVVVDHEPSRLEAVGEEIDRFADACSAVPELQRVLVSPAVTNEVKASIMDQVLDHLAVEGVARRFLTVVQGHYRLRYIGEICRAYCELMDERMGRVRARIETAVRLDDAARARVESALSEGFGAEIVADYREMPELLAGIRVLVGSRLFDGSVVGSLRRLRRAAESGQG